MIFQLNRAMIPSPFVHDLIKTLTLAEANFFREFAKRRIKDGGAQYLKLFEAVIKAEGYDEETIRQKVKARNFPALKMRLGDMVLTALEHYNNQGNAYAALQSMIQQIDILIDKELWEQVFKRMDKAEILAQEIEDFAAWRKLLDLRATILKEALDNETKPPELAGFAARSRRCTALKDNLSAYENLMRRINEARDQGGKAKVEAIASLSHEPLLQESAARLSKKAEIAYCQLHFLLSMHDNQMGAAVRQRSRRIVALLEAHPKFLGDRDLNFQYIRHTFNIGYYAASQGDTAEAEASVATLKKMQKYPVWVFERIHGIDLRLALFRQDRDGGMRTVNDMREGLLRHGGKINRDRLAAYCFQVTHFCLICGLPQEALWWLLRLRELKLPGKRRDLQDFGEILFLVCHLDLGNERVVLTEAPKCRKILKKHETLSGYERSLIQCLTSIAEAPAANKRAGYIRMNKIIAALNAKPEFSFKDNYFPFAAWLAAKINGGTPVSYLPQGQR